MSTLRYNTYIYRRRTTTITRQSGFLSSTISASMMLPHSLPPDALEPYLFHAGALESAIELLAMRLPGQPCGFTPASPGIRAKMPSRRFEIAIGSTDIRVAKPRAQL